jgi:metal-responsive CopG/Arc/MetJ family transcriptional regulator
MSAETFNVSFPPDLAEELEQAMREEGRGRSDLLQLITRDWSKRRKIERRLAEADSATATFIPHTELDQWMTERRKRD